MENNAKVYLVAIDIGVSRLVIKTTASMAVGDVVQYAVDGTESLANVVAILETYEGSDVCCWIEKVSQGLSRRKITAVWKAEKSTVEK